jgi:hypothetical protein
MARGIQIPFTLDVRQWRKGIRTVELDLDDLGDEFKDLERDADRALDDIEDSFERVGRAAKQAGDDASRGLKDGIEGGGAARAGGVLAGEVFDEFIESWGEAVRSGDYGEAIRETFSNLGQIGGAAFGPAGAAGGAIAGLFLTGIYDRITAENRREGELQTAIRDIFLGVTDEAAEAGGSSWVAYRDAVIAAARSDEAIAEALGVESFAEAIGVIEQVGKDLGQTWENDVILALTDAGPAGEAAAQRVAAAWEESNGRISELEADLQAARDKGALDLQQQAQQALDQERVRNGELEKGVGWLSDQGVIQQGLAEDAQNQYTRDQLITTEKKDQALASQETKQAIEQTPDPKLSNLSSSLGLAAGSAASMDKSIRNVMLNTDVLAAKIRNLPDLDIGITQQTANALAARAFLLNDGVPR